MIICRAAAKAGYLPAGAATYEEAAKLTQETVFDCITLDLSLGERAGVDMLRHLWVIGCKAPIIIISGCDDQTCNDSAKVAASLKLNVWESIPKPVNLATLRASLERLKASWDVAPADATQADQDFGRIRSLRIGQRLQAERRRVGKAQHDRLARCRGEPMLRRFTDDRGAERVGDDQPGVSREYLARHVEHGGEKQPVAMQAVVRPFLIGAKIRYRRFDLHNDDFAVAAERHEIGAPA